MDSIGPSTTDGTASAAGWLSLLARRAVGEFTATDILHDLCVVATHAIEVDGVGVMHADGERLRYVHADPTPVVAVERLQEQLQIGPCHESLRRRQTLVVQNIPTIGRWPEFVESADDAGLHAVLAAPLRARGLSWGVLDLYRGPGRPWTDTEVTVATSLAEVAVSYLALAADRELAKITESELQHSATHDLLTGLPNRALLFDLIEHAAATAARHRNAVAVLLVDLDRFKEVNDTLGHEAGDQLLVEVARRLRGAVRDNDTVARLSGDEFVIVCEDLSGTPRAVDAFLQAVGRRIQRALRRPAALGGVDLAITASVGAAVTRRHHNAKDLLADADRAMYAAKAVGHGNLMISQPPELDTSRAVGSSPR